MCLHLEKVATTKVLGSARSCLGSRQIGPANILHDVSISLLTCFKSTFSKCNSFYTTSLISLWQKVHSLSFHLTRNVLFTNQLWIKIYIQYLFQMCARQMIHIWSEPLWFSFITHINPVELWVFIKIMFLLIRILFFPQQNCSLAWAGYRYLSVFTPTITSCSECSWLTAIYSRQVMECKRVRLTMTRGCRNKETESKNRNKKRVFTTQSQRFVTIKVRPVPTDNAKIWVDRGSGGRVCSVTEGFCLSKSRCVCACRRILGPDLKRSSILKSAAIICCFNVFTRCLC